MSTKTVKSAVVVDYQKRRKPTKHYVYVINVTWSDNSAIVIFRRYSRFFELQTKLFEEFPDESGVKDPSKRLLPFLPGKIIFGRSNIRDVAEKRKEPINEYCQSLIKLPVQISQSDLVIDFFEPTNEDIAAMQPDNQREKKKNKEERGKVISEPIQLEQYIAIADYHKQKRSEISVLAGDIVEVIEKNENGWWFIHLDEEQGWVPASYLEPEDGSVENAVTTYEPGEERYIASTAYTANEPDEIGFQKGVVVDVLQKNIDGWWLIRYNGQDGWAPSIYLKKLDPNQALPRPHGYENITLSNEHAIPAKPWRFPKADDRGNQSSKPPPRKNTVRKSQKVKNRVRTPPSRGDCVSSPAVNEAEYITLAEYRAQGLSGGLSVQQGISVHIIEKSPNGWWYCGIGGEEGWIPSSYIERREKKAMKNSLEVTKPEVSKPGVQRSNGPVPVPRKAGVGKLPGAKPENAKVGGKKIAVAAKPSSVGNGANYVAVADYADNDHLNVSLKEGALVKVLEKSDSGWWYVQCCGAEGWAPSTYLVEKPKPRPLPKANGPQINARLQTKRPPPARPSPPSRPKNISSGQRREARAAAAPPIPSRVNKPTLPRKRNSASVENLLEKVHLKPVVQLKQARSSENLSSRPTCAGCYFALADYSDGMPDTLDMKRGDKVEVLRNDEGGWWLAKIANRTGYVPSSYLER